MWVGAAVGVSAMFSGRFAPAAGENEVFEMSPGGSAIGRCTVRATVVVF